jgi:hypothetical protein
MDNVNIEQLNAAIEVAENDLHSDMLKLVTEVNSGLHGRREMIKNIKETILEDIATWTMLRNYQGAFCPSEENKSIFD